MSNNGSSAGSVLLAFAVGALAGAAVALLYAPASGAETRRKVAQKAREGKDTLEAAVERGREVYDEVRRAASAAGNEEMA
jgi:gas vesicle protein